MNPLVVPFIITMTHASILPSISIVRKVGSLCIKGACIQRLHSFGVQLLFPTCIQRSFCNLIILTFITCADSLFLLSATYQYDLVILLSIVPFIHTFPEQF